MSTKLIFSFILLFYFTSVIAQPGRTSFKDSLIGELGNARSDSARQKLYNRLGDFFQARYWENKTNMDSAFYYLRKSVYLIDSSNNSNNPFTNRALTLLAISYVRIDKIAQGKKVFLQVIKSHQRTADKKKEADTWYSQGEILLGKEIDFDAIELSFASASKLYGLLERHTQKIDSDCNSAIFHFRLGKPALAVKETLDAIETSRKNGGYRLSTLLLLLAQEKRYAGDFNEGLKAAMEAQKNVEDNKDTLNRHDVYGELALQYEEMNEPEKSVAWYKECIKERLKLHLNGYMIYRTTYLMVVQMIKIKKAQEAFLVLQNLKKTNPPATPLENAILNQSFAYCFDATGQYANAEKHFLSMIKIYNEVEQNSDVLFIANFDVGKFYVTQHQFANAEPYLKTAFAHIEGPSASRIKDFHLFMFKVDSAAGHYLSAIEHFQKYKTLHDSLFNEAKSNQIEELNIRYDVEKKQQNFTILQKENIVQQKDLKQERLTRNYILVGVLLLVLIVTLLYNRYQLKQRANKQLELSQHEIEKQNLALQHLVSEKEWLLKEIHHRVKNNLHTISGLLDAQSAYLLTEEASNAIGDSQHRVQAMSLLHQKLFHSESLSTVEMHGYIYELVGYLEHSFGTERKLKFDLDIDNLILGVSHALPIGLILNEAITNAIKYAFSAKKEGTINIRLKHQSTNQFLLSIADNGIGLPLDFDIQKSGSMGMNLMKGLSEDIQAVFSIKNNNGTEINISFVYDFSTTEDFSFYEMISSNS